MGLVVSDQEVKCEAQFQDRIWHIRFLSTCIPQLRYVSVGDLCHFFGGIWADFILADDDNPAALITVRILKQPMRPSDLVHVDALAGIGGFRHAAVALGITGTDLSGTQAPFSAEDAKLALTAKNSYTCAAIIFIMGSMRPVSNIPIAERSVAMIETWN